MHIENDITGVPACPLPPPRFPRLRVSPLREYLDERRHPATPIIPITPSIEPTP